MTSSKLLLCHCPLFFLILSLLISIRLFRVDQKKMIWSSEIDR